MTISENLKSIRVERGYKQEQIAGALGISRSTYTNFENGRDPDIELLMRLADIYQLSLDSLVGRQFVSHDPSNNIINSPDEESSAKHTWRRNVKNRKSEEMLMYMLYLLNAVRADSVLKTTEDILQRIMKFVIKTSYLFIQGKKTDIDKESFRLSTSISNKVLSLSSEMEIQTSNILHPEIYDSFFTREELLNPEDVKRYFHVNLEEILKSE